MKKWNPKLKYQRLLEQMESKVEVSQITSLLKEQPSESLQLQSIPKRSLYGLSIKVKRKYYYIYM
jgi:hypothetical protein